MNLKFFCAGAICALAKLGHIDLLDLAHRRRGISRHESLAASGELHLLRDELPKRLTKDAVIVEIGANVGEYNTEIRHYFPEATIHAIEPSAGAFALLRAATKGKKVFCHQIAIGAENGELKLWTYEGDKHSSHASLHAQVLTALHGAQALDSEAVQVKTLSEFCESQNITHIDFLKIDTEGHELAVLQGARNMLERGQIKCIQWEFNSMNVISRVFLKDFFEILSGYAIYRLNTDELIKLEEYSPRDEIFAFSNFVAFHL